MLEICSSYADIFLERQIVRQPQPEVSDQDSPFQTDLTGEKKMVKIVNGTATSPLAGKLMQALQHSKSKKLQTIWKTSLQNHKTPQKRNQQKES